MMKVFSCCLFFVIVAGFTISCNVNQSNTGSAKEISRDSLINRGKYLVNIIGCGDCHSPKKMGPHGPEPDTALLLSGHPAQMPLGKIDTSSLKSWVLFNMVNTAAVGPWGVSFASNITSDSTGIGAWTEEQFFTALRTGKAKGISSNRMLLPPMPWPNFAQMSDEDMKAMFLYLKSTQPVSNVPPQPIAPDQLGKL